MLQEIMSIMGGKFHTQLTFRLEKNLLAMVISYIYILVLCYFQISRTTSGLYCARIQVFYKCYSVLALGVIIYNYNC